MLPAVKSPPTIKLLHELCARNNLTPTYQLLCTEGSVHEPSFKIAITAGDVLAIACGQSKKKARYAAAREAIKRLKKKPEIDFEGVNIECLGNIEDSPEVSVAGTLVREPNPVGKLQEICMKMRVNPPDYDTCDEKGPAHDRLFFITCAVTALNLSSVGQGKSKKLAKRQAAELLLSKLEDSGMHEEESAAKAQKDKDPINIDADDTSHFITSRRDIAKLSSNVKLSIDDLKKDIELIEADDVNEDLYHELLYEALSSVGHHFEVEQLSPGHCLLTIRNDQNKIVMTSFGMGSDIKAAMKSAALNTYRQLIVLKEPLTRLTKPPAP